MITYESIAFRFASVLIGDDNSFKNVAELFEITPHFIGGSFPGKASNKHFGERRISEL